uniref:MFS transporter, PPP family, 3-phenylpropionic acid transporter n=1 Tax=Candidatus Kentrum sp. DK TaxID=2126562 RepID=A0A450SRF9_9GAMM|nr:MAG: MFS transporter, PPP family, 3-phenylpropionic acid transporter [Candidatus Kentron sp. DK]
MPYFGLYLQSTGFDPWEIGQLIGVLLATKIIAPNIWGILADRHGKRVGIVRKASLISALAFAGIYFPFDSGFHWLLLVLATFGFFWNATLPLVEATTLNCLGEHTHRYGRIRLWGSIGFILTVLLFGELIQQYSVRIIPHGVLVLLIAIVFSSFRLPEYDGPPSPGKPEPFGDAFRKPQVLALLVVSFLMQLSHGPFYTFYSIYLDGHSYTPSVIGRLWTIGVVAEVVFFLFMPWVLQRVSRRSLLLLSFVLAALRWTLVALFPMHLSIQVFAQLLHAATFGVFHGAALLLIHDFFVGNHQGRGQALYNSIGFGAGSAAGALGGGFVWYSFGGVTTYLVAAGIGVVAFFIVWRWIREE